MLFSSCSVIHRLGMVDRCFKLLVCLLVLKLVLLLEITVLKKSLLTVTEFLDFLESNGLFLDINMHPVKIFVELDQALLVFISESEVSSRVALLFLTNVTDLLFNSLDLLLVPACSATITLLLCLSRVELTGKLMLGKVKF